MQKNNSDQKQAQPNYSRDQNQSKSGQKISIQINNKCEPDLNTLLTKKISQTLYNEDNHQSKKKTKSQRKKSEKQSKGKKDNPSESILKQKEVQTILKKSHENLQKATAIQSTNDDCAKQFSNIILKNIQKQSKNRSLEKSQEIFFSNTNQELISSCSVETLKKINYSKLQDLDFFKKSESHKPSKRLLILQYENQEVYIHENYELKSNNKSHIKTESVPDDIKHVFLQKKNQKGSIKANFTLKTYDTSNPSSFNPNTQDQVSRSNQQDIEQIMKQKTNSYINQTILNGNFFHPMYQIQNNYGYQQYYKQYMDYFEEKMYQFNRKRKTISYQQSKDYIIQLSKIQSDGRTTIMIRNIPNKYTQDMLLQLIMRNNKKKYDFFYLPIDYTNSCNMGYAFINFLNTKFIGEFYKEFNGKKWEKFNSEKICSLSYARIQGTISLLTHIQNSQVMHQKYRKNRSLIDPDQQLMNNLQTIIQKQKHYQ